MSKDDFADAEGVVRDAWWAQLHPDPAVREARVRVLEAREALRRAQSDAALAEAQLRLAEAQFDERRAARALTEQADMSRPQ